MGLDPGCGPTNHSTSHAVVAAQIQKKKIGGWPGGLLVKSAHSASAAGGSWVWILGADLRTTQQAMLWWHLIYKIEEDGHRH